jgi:hypothetical protein
VGAYNTSTWEAETGGLQVRGQPGPQSEILSQNYKKRKKARLLKRKRSTELQFKASLSKNLYKDPPSQPTSQEWWSILVIRKKKK